MEPIGFVFVVFFGVVLIIQIIGMLIHRWGTISQIISTTNLPMCQRKPEDNTDEGDLQKHAHAIVRELQRETQREDERRNTRAGIAGRRNTVSALLAAQNESRQTAVTDLEKSFRERLQSIRKLEITKHTFFY